MTRINWIILLTLGLVLFGVVMVGNASFVSATSDFGDKWYYVRLQAIWVVVGIISMSVAARISLKWLESVSQLFLIGNIALLFLVLIPGIGYKLLGARRWLGIGPLGFQPAELVKLSLTIYLARFFTKPEFKVKTFLSIVGIILGLIMLEPDMGTAMIVVLISFSVYFGSGMPLRPLAWIIPAATAALGILIVVSPYRLNRLKTFFDYSSDPQGSSYHIRQALLGIGSGGVWGVGFGASKQKYQFLPEVTTDSIFAVIAEEFGFVGSTALIIVFLSLVNQGLKVSQTSKSMFGSNLALGVTAWVGWQFVINIAAMTAIVPLTGIPLPFVSYGGSSLVVLLTAMGLLTNVAKNT